MNPEIVGNASSLPLSADAVEKPPVSVGERVLAIGSPLSTENILTSGLISRIEPGTYRSDVNINPGNSGGPLFNMVGQVIGINTFGESAGTGPGVAGIIRIHVAQSVLSRAIAKLDSAPIPSAARLPVEPNDSYPTDVLKTMAARYPYLEKQYSLEVGKFVVLCDTPLSWGSRVLETEKALAETHKKRAKEKIPSSLDASLEIYDWRHVEPIVKVIARPKSGLTGGSVAALIFLGPNVPTETRFKADFKRMELRRDGVPVEAIWPQRIPLKIASQNGLNRMADATFSGMYSFPPEAFKPGATLSLAVWDENRKEPWVEEIPRDVVARVWSDFKPYFESLTAKIAGDSGQRAPEPPSAINAVHEYLLTRPGWHSIAEISTDLWITGGDVKSQMDKLIASGVVAHSEQGGKDVYAVK